MKRFLTALLIGLLINGTDARAQESGPVAPPGVQGPSSATNAHVAVFSGTSGQIIADGGAPVGTGTVTSVTCGTGLTGGTITGSGTCAADFGTASSKIAQGGVITAAGPTGSATVTPIITYNAAGQLTTVTSATVTPAVGSVTGLGTGVADALGNNASASGGFPLWTTGPWTPIDSSGASLTLTTTYAIYMKIGALVCAFAQIAYPSTSDGTAALIGGLPVTAAHYGTGAVNSGIAQNFILRVNTGATTISPLLAASASITNVQLADATLIFTICYPT